MNTFIDAVCARRKSEPFTSLEDLCEHLDVDPSTLPPPHPGKRRRTLAHAERAQLKKAVASYQTGGRKKSHVYPTERRPALRVGKLTCSVCGFEVFVSSGAQPCGRCQRRLPSE